jgi:3-oxoacyl-[acyl-carrier protein] reductase
MKYALVTGGSRGIGRAICVKLASMGYHILINYKSNDTEASRTLQLVESQNGSATLLKFDVCDGEAVEKSIQQWLTDNPEKNIEVLVNNAGVREDALMIWMTDSQWKNVLRSSLDGLYYVTKAVISQMLVKRYGRIVNVASLSGVKGMPGQINYSAAKAGVIGATRALAQEVARRNVTVNAVAPGFIKTDMTRDLKEDDLKKLIPMQRFGEPEEVAEAVGFLASEKASYITGTVIDITGGLL